MQRYLLIVGSVVCFLGVAFGSFGAHALSQLLQGKAVGWFDTALQYQFIHGIGLLFCGLLSPVYGRNAVIAGVVMFIGVLVFCGSLYAMSLGAPRWLGMITPIGGICLMFSWVVLAWGVIQRTGDK